MRPFRDSQEERWTQDSLSFTLGAVGGLAIGVLISRALPPPREFRDQIRDRARSVARRLRPARLRRYAVEQEELDQLEDVVLRAFLDDPVLSERGVDIGAISHGIIELSGSVWTDDEADMAVALANRIPGVRTVVNRLDVESFAQRASARGRSEGEWDATFVHQEARTGGMGRRRQGLQTDPDRTDDSQHQRERALAAADRDQYADEDFAHESP
ncbi:MAG: BON domain-containing protein, partial [Gemmatimonadota bacterium]